MATVAIGLAAQPVGDAAAAFTGKYCGKASVEPILYRPVGSGVSFQYAGRTVELRNGAFSEISYGTIARGQRAGDRVWLDRADFYTRTQFPLVTVRNNWQQCGPRVAICSYRGCISPLAGYLYNLHRPIRVCFDHWSGARRVQRCGRWYADQS